MKFDIILADPPWPQKRGGRKAVRPNSSGIDLDYSILTTEDIEFTLNDVISNFAAEQHCLFLWTIDKHLCKSEQIIHNLGYKLHARMVWNKVTGIPAAFTIRFGHEYLLWCYKPKLLPINIEQRGKIHSVFTEKVEKHSQKPKISYEIIEKLYPNAKKLELFARNYRENWYVWGDEVENSINYKYKNQNDR